MRSNKLVRTLALTLIAAAPLRLTALDLSFLDQAPLRFLTPAETELLANAVDRVLDEAEDGESRSWQGDQTGNSGTVTAIRTFEDKGHSCRRIQMVTLANQASRGRAESRMDMCRIDGEWRILRMVQ